MTITSGTLHFNDVTSILGGTIILTTTGTLTCTGINCGLLHMPTDVPLPISVLNELWNTSSVHPIVLGTWDFGWQETGIEATSLAVTTLSRVSPYPAMGAMTFGPGIFRIFPSVPEPCSAALVLLGLGALSLRSRKA